MVCAPSRDGVYPKGCLSEQELKALLKARGIPFSSRDTREDMIARLESKFGKCTNETESCYVPDENKDIFCKYYKDVVPDDWIHQPDKWWSNKELERCVGKYEERYHDVAQFLGVCPIDTFSYEKTKVYTNHVPPITRKTFQRNNDVDNFYIIFNTSLHGNDGRHWVSAFFRIDHLRKTINFYYYNSTGPIAGVPDDTMTFIYKLSQIHVGYDAQYESNPVRHQFSKTECGTFCLNFLVNCLMAVDQDPDAPLDMAQLCGAIFDAEVDPDALMKSYRQHKFHRQPASLKN